MCTAQLSTNKLLNSLTKSACPSKSTKKEALSKFSLKIWLSCTEDRCAPSSKPTFWSNLRISGSMIKTQYRTLTQSPKTSGSADSLFPNSISCPTPSPKVFRHWLSVQSQMQNLSRNLRKSQTILQSKKSWQRSQGTYKRLRSHRGAISIKRWSPKAACSLSLSKVGCNS